MQCKSNSSTEMNCHLCRSTFWPPAGYCRRSACHLAGLRQPYSKSLAQPSRWVQADWCQELSGCRAHLIHASTPTGMDLSSPWNLATHPRVADMTPCIIYWLRSWRPGVWRCRRRSVPFLRLGWCSPDMGACARVTREGYNSAGLWTDQVTLRSFQE